ncbi:MAG TPA: flagellar hook-filament junction protein FlgL [Morganella sp. (in: Bacteria)]|nr:flagellar hook-filament junction protein FlgL [Morganella sp. (in: enterobacteria)]
MRFSTNLMFSQRVTDMNNSTARWMEAGSKLASGKRVSKPSDDAQASAQAVRVSQSETRNQQYASTRGYAKTGMTLQMSILSKMNEVSTQMDTTIIQGSNQGTLSDADRDSLASQLQGQKDQLISLGNTTDGNGRYIFGGYESDKPPFEVDATTGDVIYRGGDKSITQNVGSDREMISYFAGSEVFATTTNAKGEKVADMFSAINKGLEGLKIPQQNASQADLDKANAAMGEANKGIKAGMDKISNIEAKQGLQLQEIDSLDFLSDTRKIQNDSRMSELMETDWTGTISDYQKEMSMFQASQSIFKDLNSMSLFNR